MADNVDDAGETKKTKSGAMKLMVYTFLGLALAGDVAVRAMVFFRQGPTAALAVGLPGSSEAKDGEKAEETVKAEVKSTMNLEPFLVNLADKDYIRFVKASFRLGFPDPSLGEDLAKDNVTLAVTRDAIITVLTTKSSDQILSEEGKIQLRKEIQERVNAVLPRGKVTEVYIMDFQVQL
jgi:flagellar FliL protein